MRVHIEAIAGSQQDSTLSGGLAEWEVVLSAHQPGERGHAALRRNPSEYVAMVRHEALEELEVSRGDFLGLAEHDVTFADCDFRKNFSGGAVADREVGARGPVLLAALGVVLDHPSRAHPSNRKCLRQVGDHGGVRQARRRFRFPSVVDRMVDLVTHQLDSALGGEVVQGFHFAVTDGRSRGVVRAISKLILVNSPHNPTGATIGDGEMEALHDFTAERGIQLVSDEVYHPIYHGRQTKSAARLRHATVIADLSKAFSIAGVRTGWMIEHDAQRRQQYWTARAYFSICNTTTGEILSEIAIRKRDVVLGKTQDAATRNLKLLERFMADHRDVLGWIPPQGGMTAFPWLVSGENDRPFWQAATERGILLAPGDCFDAPSHFRLGFAAAGDNFSKALDRFGAFVKSWSAKMVTA